MTSQPFKVVVAGGRTFNDYQLLKTKLDNLLSQKSYIQVISGTAKGADQLGEKYANEMGYEILRFAPDWEKHGKAAGYIRNKQMAGHADAVVCFWDGKSRGTKHMIDIAKSMEIPLRIIRY